MHQITIVSSGPQGQNEYQYDNQPDEISLTRNASHAKHATVPSYTERCQETVYEDIEYYPMY